MNKKTLILGIGNLLLGDEGVGVHAINVLRKEKLPEWATLLDGGTGGFALFDIMKGYEKIIVIDAVEMKAAPGTVKKIELDEIASFDSHLTLSAHGFNFADVIEMSKTLYNRVPDMTIIGVQPKSIAPSDKLSPELTNSIEKIKEAVLEELSASGQET